MEKRGGFFIFNRVADLLRKVQKNEVNNEAIELVPGELVISETSIANSDSLDLGDLLQDIRSARSSARVCKRRHKHKGRK